MLPEEVDRLLAESDERLIRRLATMMAIEELHGLGMSYRAIGRVLGVSHEYVRQTLRLLGVNGP